MTSLTERLLSAETAEAAPYAAYDSETSYDRPASRASAAPPVSYYASSLTSAAAGTGIATGAGAVSVTITHSALAPPSGAQDSKGDAKESDQTVTLKDGSKYTGPMKNGYPDGKGTIAYPADHPGGWDRYTGDFVDGVPDGEGHLLFKDKTTYQGSFSQGASHGQGTLITGPRGVKIIGEFQHGAIHNGEGYFPGYKEPFTFIEGHQYHPNGCSNEGCTGFFCTVQ
ncbi:MAG: hypothetical protein HYX48_03565 [Chlamydiales bacterium]|nr:hypothetical protein [Chlamydiales bacterium]